VLVPTVMYRGKMLYFYVNNRVSHHLKYDNAYTEKYFVNYI